MIDVRSFSLKKISARTNFYVFTRSYCIYIQNSINFEVKIAR